MSWQDHEEFDESGVNGFCGIVFWGAVASLAWWLCVSN